MNTASARLSYSRVLMQFSRLVRVCRRRCRLRVDELSQLSNITVRRLQKYEEGSAPPHWGDAVVLARVFGVRLSSIVASVKRPVATLSIDQYKCLLDYAHARSSEQRREFRDDLQQDRRIHLEDAAGDKIQDASIADWPPFLLPSLDDALIAEGSRLHAVFQVLDALMKCNDDLSPLEDVIGMQGIEAGSILVNVHGVMSGVQARLNSLQIRHAGSASARCIEGIERQRSYISKAIESVAVCSLSGSAATSDSAQQRRGNEYSMHLPGAMDRALVASFGLIEIAKSLRSPAPAVVDFGEMKRKSASHVQE